ncbi:molybdopterin-synthase adenylyltransferase MoeB [Pseudochrobactrum sp. HB0163]|uniref:molybdopterin-synthase adenylyltransferase MoeB n=1 Tax=Pseudochrobactrum sp. HB0163 TaxID=3450708 RepID=UPI003F6DE604
MRTPGEPFSELEIERYARHIVLPEIGGAGQQKLKNARVLVVGAGGLGSPALLYLAAAGVGHLGIADDDMVTLSNLQRQIVHSTNSIGENKTESAAATLARINPHIKISCHTLRLTPDNVTDLFSDYDIIVDGTDNFTTRYLVADHAALLKKALVTAAMGRFDGSLTVLKPYESDSEGNPYPCYRDLFPQMPPEGMIPSCAEAGVIGALPAILGSLQAMEVIKLITGIGEPLLGRLLLYDALGARFEIMHYKKRAGQGIHRPKL